MLRSLDQKAGFRGHAPRQLHVFDDPGGTTGAGCCRWPRSSCSPPRSSHRSPESGRTTSSCAQWGAVGLPFDHDDIVEMAVARVRSAYSERPDLERLVPEPFTLRDLRRLHEASWAAAYSPTSSRGTSRTT